MAEALLDSFGYHYYPNQPATECSSRIFEYVFIQSAMHTGVLIRSPTASSMVTGSWHYHCERLTTQQTNLYFIALYTTLYGLNYKLWQSVAWVFSKFTVELDNSCSME